MKHIWKLSTGFILLFIVAVLIGQPSVRQGRSPGTVPPSSAINPVSDQPIVSDPVVAGISPPVRDLPPADPAVGLEREVSPRFQLNALPGDTLDPTWQDPIVQTQVTGNTPTPLLSFDGLNRSQGGGATPPDTVGAVGLNHYVQMVNATVFAVWDKTGTLVQGPTDLNDVWTSGGCASSNSGDPIVSYDWLADRWVLAQFAAGFSNGICVAVSQTGDPTGVYHTYQFNYGGFPDYFKIGVWTDAYYIGANQPGANVHALDRASMLVGDPAAQISFTLADASFHSMPMPADLDGSTPPPAGEPGIFARHIDDATAGGADRIELYEFDVDWVTPGNSTFTGPTSLNTSSFAVLCGFSFSCIRQPGTGQRIDSITEWPMFRLAYRNFGTHEVLLYNHAVNVGGDQAGVRWYEMQRNGGSWSINQQSTHAPDADSRWMAGIAMDGDGNIAVAYNVSSSSTFPSIRYATRLATDPPNTLQAEESLVAGGGSQTNTNRWGDYSNLTVDPADDCTFWFTGEYYSANGSNWRTRIGAFRIPECGAVEAMADMSISQTDSADPVLIGSNLTYDITVQNLGTSPANNVMVTDSIPAGVTFISAIPSTGSCNESGGTVTCNLGTMPDATSATIAVTVVPNAVGTISNVVSVSADETDPVASNNDDTEMTEVIDPPSDYFLWLPIIARP